MPVQHVSPLLGRGIYDVAEISRLVRRTPFEVSTWAAKAERPLLLPQGRRLFSFHDLITANVVADLRRRGVPLMFIRDARSYLQDDLNGIAWPLAHAAGIRSLATVGRNIYYKKHDTWLDASAGGQLPFAEVTEPLLDHLQFDEDDMAQIWRPVDGIVLDPRVQAGAPCLEGTRLTTQFIAELVEAGDDPADVADDFNVEVSLVGQALQYEAALAA